MTFSAPRRFSGIYLWIALVLVSMLMASCGGSAAPAIAPTPTAIPTVAPAESPASASTESGGDVVAASPADDNAEEALEAPTEPAPEAAPEEEVAADAAEEPAAIVDVPAIATRSTEAAEGVLLVDASVDRGAISPLVYGANTGPLWVLMPAVWEKAAALDLGIIHFPGGEWGDNFDLTGKQVDDSVALTERLGAVPFFSVRLPGGSAAKAAALVDYANNQMNYDVVYWAIGNEPNLYAPRHTEEDWTPQHYADRWREWAIAMKEVDPTIKLMGPEVTGFVGVGDDLPDWQAELADWMRIFLETNGDMVDIVSFHRYPFPNRGGTQAENATVEELLTQPREMDGRILPDLRTMIHEITGRDIPIAITEYGLDSRSIIRGETAPNAPLSAIWWGDSLARNIDQGVEIITYWHLTTRDAQSGHGIFTPFSGRPVYYTFDLYSRFGDTLVSADAGNPDVFAIAALREDGALTVMLSNTSQESQTLTVDLQDAPAQTVEAWRVTGEKEGKVEVEDGLISGESITLPPTSLTLFVLADQ